MRPRSDGLPRVVLVTGAAGGIGHACAAAFAAEGDTVALADIDEAGCSSTASELVGDRHSVHTVDLGSSASIASLLGQVEAFHGGVDVLVNAAAVLKPAPLLQMTAAEWDETLAVNARGAVLLSQAVARRCVERGVPGRIVLFASILARGPARLANVAYSASKAAVVQAARCMALELAEHRITVNVVSPGSTNTEMLTGVQVGNDAARLEGVVRGDLSQWRLGIPLGALARPQDQAAAAVFLASEAAAHITGHELIVDGGQTLV